jgi:hypothetical protein
MELASVLGSGLFAGAKPRNDSGAKARPWRLTVHGTYSRALTLRGVASSRLVSLLVTPGIMRMRRST